MCPFTGALEIESTLTLLCQISVQLRIAEHVYCWSGQVT